MMTEQNYFPLYRWCSFGILCSMIARNITNSIMCGLSCKVCHITLFSVCICTLHHIMARIYERICSVCVSVHFVILCIVNIILLTMIFAMFSQTVQLVFILLTVSSSAVLMSYQFLQE